MKMAIPVLTRIACILRCAMMWPTTAFPAADAASPNRIHTGYLGTVTKYLSFCRLIRKGPAWRMGENVL